MDLQRSIKHHKHEVEHWRRLGACPASEFSAEDVNLLEDIERQFGDAIIEGES
jgi:hypothetical protein